MKSAMNGILYIVSTPIGNPDDMTLRARRTLSEADGVICEEERAGSTLLTHYGIVKPLVELNEHNEAEQTLQVLERLSRGENLALVSDHGTPLVADPGAPLVRRAIEAGIRVVPVPGVSSIVAALVSSGLPASRFRFLGQLPPKTEQRRRALSKYKDITETMILLEAPYRLMPLLRALHDAFGSQRRLAVVCNLTMRGERIVRGTIADVLKQFELEPFKGEFVMVVEGAPRQSQQRS